MPTLDDYLDVAVRAARTAGQVLLDHVDGFSVREKGPADLVTTADLAAQKTVRDLVTGAFPDHDFLGEEADGAPRAGGSHCWIVDPLDGTTNYVHQIPFYGPSIALEIDGELAVGVVYNPTADECFSATRGGGARLNGRPIHVSETTELSQAVVATGFPPGMSQTVLNLDHFGAFVRCSQSVRRMGSAALNLAYVACARFDGNWATSLHPWDAAAGVLLVREAGGVVTAMNGGPYDVHKPTVLASNGRLHEPMQTVLQRRGQE